MYVYCVESFAHIECYRDCSCRGSHLVECATVLFNVRSAVTVECCFCTRVAWICLLLCKEEGSSPVSLQLLRGGIWAFLRYHCLCLCKFWNGDYVSQIPYVWYVGVKILFLYFVLMLLGPALW